MLRAPGSSGSLYRRFSVQARPLAAKESESRFDQWADPRGSVPADVPERKTERRGASDAQERSTESIEKVAKTSARGVTTNLVFKVPCSTFGTALKAPY